MPIVAADWSVDKDTTTVDYIGDDHTRFGGTTPSYATVIEFHRWIQGLADDAMFSGDDEMDITIQTPTDRSTDNIITMINNWTITDAAAEHLYDGSIIQSGGNTIFDGIVNFGNAQSIQILQDGARLTDDWWNTGSGGLNADLAAGISHRFMVKVRDFGADIDGRRLIGTARRFNFTYSEFKINGSSRGNNVLALSESDDLNNATAEGTVSGWTSIVNDNEGYIGIDADGNGSNEFYYSNWEYGTQAVNDFYERMKWLTREGSAETIYGFDGEEFRGITHDITYDTLTGTFDELQDLVWGTEVAYDAELSSGLTVGEYYTFATSGAVGQLLALDDNGTTGFAIFAIQPGSGTVVDNDAFTRIDGTANDGATVNVTINNASAVGGKGRILADDGTDQVWIQVYVGAAPVDNLPIWEATTSGVYDNATGDNALVNATITERAISTPFVGQSTGTAIIGSYGLGIGADDLTASDKVTDLTNTVITPPNNVTFSVIGLVVGEDYVLVGPESGGTLQEGQFTIATTALTAANITSVEINTTIPSDTPSTGTIRVADNNGLFRRLEYTSYAGATFTIDPAASEAYDATTATAADFDTTNASIGNNVFISYIDELATTTTESFTAVYSSDRALFIRVRDGDATPIKTFETTGTLGSAGGSATVIRTSDE